MYVNFDQFDSSHHWFQNFNMISELRLQKNKYSVAEKKNV